jgi:hypothetical protein
MITMLSFHSTDVNRKTLNSRCQCQDPEAIHYLNLKSDTYIFTKNRFIYKDYILPLKGVCNNHLFLTSSWFTIQKWSSISK